LLQGWATIQAVTPRVSSQLWWTNNIKQVRTLSLLILSGTFLCVDNILAVILEYNPNADYLLLDNDGRQQ